MPDGIKNICGVQARLIFMIKTSTAKEKTPETNFPKAN